MRSLLLHRANCAIRSRIISGNDSLYNSVATASLRCSSQRKNNSTASAASNTDGGLFSISDLQRPSDFQRLATRAQLDCNRLRKDIGDTVNQQQNRISLSTARQLLFWLDAISRSICNVIDATELTRQVHAVETWRVAADQAFYELSAYMSQLNSDPSLYQAILLVRTSKEIWNQLREEEQRFTVLMQAEFERDGIHLPDAEREQVRQIQGQLTELETLFSRNLVTCEKRFHVEHVAAVHEVIPAEALRQSFQMEARKGENGRSFITLSNNHSHMPILQALLRYSTNPSLRKDIYMEAMTAVPENLSVLDALIRTRQQLARSLGFSSYAERFLRDQMAQSPEAVQGFLQQLQAKVQPVYKQQMEEMKRAKGLVEKNTDDIQPWDVTFYTNILQTSGNGQDVTSSVSPYMTVGNCLNAMHILTKRVFGIEMKEEMLAPNERWDVCGIEEKSFLRKYSFVGPDGRPLGFLYLDLHPRPNKYTHAAHFTVRCGCRTTPWLDETEEDGGEDNYQLPVVALVCNLSSGACLTHGEVETLFHEFGHALHSLLSRTEFQHMSGTRAAMDFVETPSHLMENFVWDADFLRIVGCHHISGETIPDDLIEQLQRSRNSFAAIERQNQILYAKLDQALFGLPDPRTSTEIFADLHHQAGVPFADGTHWHSRFGHLVTYGAGYYGATTVCGKFCERDCVEYSMNDNHVTRAAGILFGTLVANTVNTLIEKNSEILRCGILMGEAVRTARCTFDSFTKEYRDAANDQLDIFVDNFLRNFWSDRINIVTLRQMSPYLEECTRCIHHVGRHIDSNPGAAVSEAYAAMQRIKDLQSDLMAATQRKFPWFHYANLCTLALSTCAIFLIDTDPDTVSFTAEPQVALGWSLLVGTLSMLAVVVYDLNSPITGITRQISAMEGFSFDDIERYLRCWNRHYDYGED